MLDVHPPEHAVHTWRDFFIHIGTIVIGLLLAIGLEQTVEAIHHHHQREETEALLRQEIQDNQGKVSRIVKQADVTRANMLRALQFLQDMRNGKPADPSGITLGFSEGPLESTGWKTASATGVLSYMRPADVQKFAGAYEEQQLFEEAEARALEHVERLQTYVSQRPGAPMIDPKDLGDAIPDVRNVIADLSAMQDLGRGTLASYAEALKE